MLAHHGKASSRISWQPAGHPRWPGWPN